MVNVLKLQSCEGCDDTGLQIQTEGFMKGMVRPCPKCARSARDYINQYGTDVEQQPEVYLDTRKGAYEKCDDYGS